MSHQGPKRIPPTDILSLMRHIVQLSPRLEQVWSDALAPAGLAAAEDGFPQRLQAMLLAVAQHAEAGDARLQEVGVDTMLPAWPVSSQTVLAADPADGAARWRLAMMAQLQSFEALVEATNALVEQSEEIDLLTGARRRWWSSEAFGLLESRAREVQRTTRMLAAAEAELLERTPTSPSRRDRADAFDAAVRAYRRGDPNAALLHAVHVARLTVGDAVGWPALRARPDRAVVADLLERAGRVLDAYADGRATPEAGPVASVLLPRLERIVFDGAAET